SRAYHDRQWARKMIELGLMPSSTGMAGGKITGSHMQHYIIVDGPFSRTFSALAATGWKLNLESAHRAGNTASPPTKGRATCPVCAGNAWAKPDYTLACVACGNVEMIPETRVFQSYDQAAR